MGFGRRRWKLVVLALAILCATIPAIALGAFPGDPGESPRANTPNDPSLNGGRGKDKVRGGGGDDQIRARRGGKDKISCGGGDDVVFVNPEKDEAKQNCETVREGGG